MLKTLQWVYELGKNHERNRIKRIISVETNQISLNRNLYLADIDDEKVPEKKRQEMIDAMRIQDEVRQILSAMMAPKYIQSTTGVSLLDDDEL